MTGEKGTGYNAVLGLEKYTESPPSHWRDEDIFSSWKNLLYRANTQIQRVSYDEDTITINVKLNTKQGYRYLYKNNDFIESVTLNGNYIGTGTSDMVFNTKEDLKIVLRVNKLDNALESSEKVSFFDTENDNYIRAKIYQALCIVEEADCLIDLPASTDGHNGEDLLNVSYFDYQIPNLNSHSGDPITQVHNSYYTEDQHSLLSYGQKGHNLVVHTDQKTGYAEASPISSNKPFTAQLFYDMGMPAACKYM